MKKRKTFWKFLSHPMVLLQLVGLLLFVVVGVNAMLYESFWVGVGFTTFLLFVIVMLVIERYKKWKKLYK